MAEKHYIGTLIGYAKSVRTINQATAQVVELSGLEIDDSGLATLLDTIGRKKVLDHFGAGNIVGLKP